MTDSRVTSKIFVLDTSVILYDSDAINHFDEHDVAVPITVLEELDQFKKGNGVINMHARQFIRQLDHLSEDHDLRRWIPIDGPGSGSFQVVTPERGSSDSRLSIGSDKNDHRILDAALQVTRAHAERPVILVSKDINLRVKARSLGLQAEDYESVRVQDIEHLYSGLTDLQLADDGIVDRLHEAGHLEAAAVVSEPPPSNHFFILRGPSRSALAAYNPTSRRLERILKTTAYGITPRNAEQTFALSALLNPEVQLVTLGGPAGTGKTLLALAAALEQRHRYRQILLTRPIVPLGNRDLGFLPGDVSSKVSPYMQPLWDNLGVIRGQWKNGQKETAKLEELVEQEKLQILPLAYIRGRSLSRVIFIVDEAQNLTPLEVKTIITRAGEGTKVVFTGDIRQIDTPYLDAHTNGLSYLIDRMKGIEPYAHVDLKKGERSELANLASRLL